MAKRLYPRAILNSNLLNRISRENELSNVICRKLHRNAIHTKEIQIPVPWGHISAKVWGDITKHRPILALHGWQDNAGTWDPLAPMLIKDRAIVAIDFPGHGLSSWIPPGMHYYNWDMPRHIITLKEYFKLDKVALLSHSMGSLASLRYACSFPDEIEFLVALEALLHDNDFDANQYSQLMKNAVTTQTRDQKLPSYTMEEIKQRWYVGTGKSVQLESVEYLTNRGTQPSKSHPDKYCISRDSRLKYMMFNTEDKSLVESLFRRLKCPTLYIKATGSPYANDSYSLDVYDLLQKNNPNFEKHVVSGTHHVHLNNPELVAPLILNFYNKHNIPS